MVVEVRYDADIKTARKALDNDWKAARDAMRQALNKTAAKGRTQTVRTTQAFVNQGARKKVKQRQIRDRIKLVRANYRLLVAQIEMRAINVPVSNYHATQTGTGVIVQTPRGPLSIPGAFLAKVGAGHRGIFLRHRSADAWPRRKHRESRRVQSGAHVGKLYRPALPIDEVFTAALTVRNTDREIFVEVERVTDKAWPIELDRAIAFQLRKRGMT